MGQLETSASLKQQPLATEQTSQILSSHWLGPVVFKKTLVLPVATGQLFQVTRFTLVARSCMPRAIWDIPSSLLGRPLRISDSVK